MSSTGIKSGLIHQSSHALPSSKQTSSNKQNPKQSKRTNQTMSRKSKFKLILLDKNFESEKPTSLEGLTDHTCRWPIGHPDQESFYFCGRNPIEDFPYCKLHVLYPFQPKNQKEDVLDKEDEIPEFIEKKVKSAG